MPTNDTYVQVAADGVGKKMETALTGTQATDSTGLPIDVHRQRAEIVGTVADIQWQILQCNLLVVQLLQAILTNLNTTSNINPQPEDFPVDL